MNAPIRWTGPDGGVHHCAGPRCLHAGCSATSTPENDAAVQRLTDACKKETAARAAYLDATRAWDRANSAEVIAGNFAMNDARWLWLEADREERAARVALGGVGR
jgi:hypothetical protein